MKNVIQDEEVFADLITDFVLDFWLATLSKTQNEKY